MSVWIEAVVFLSAIIGLLLAVGVFIFHALTRGKDSANEIEVISDAIDQVANEAVQEVNRTSKLALAEVNDKLEEMNKQHQSLLFLYQLMDDKQKDISALPDLPNDSAFLEEVAKKIGTFTTVPAANPADMAGNPPEADSENGNLANEAASGTFSPSYNNTIRDDISSTVKVNGVLSHPKYMQVKELLAQGLSDAEIARQLGMGLGEVKLLINLGGR